MKYILFTFAFCLTQSMGSFLYANNQKLPPHLVIKLDRLLTKYNEVFPAYKKEIEAAEKNRGALRDGESVLDKITSDFRSAYFDAHIDDPLLLGQHLLNIIGLSIRKMDDLRKMNDLASRHMPRYKETGWHDDGRNGWTCTVEYKGEEFIVKRVPGPYVILGYDFLNGYQTHALAFEISAKKTQETLIKVRYMDVQRMAFRSYFGLLSPKQVAEVLSPILKSDRCDI